MKFGMNVSQHKIVDTGEFIAACSKAGIKHTRIMLDFDRPATELVGVLAKFGMKSCFGLVEFDQRVFKPDWNRIVDKYTFICNHIPTHLSLGILLPVGIDNVVMMTRKEKVQWMNKLSEIIHKSGHKVVMPTTMKEFRGNNWEAVNFDILDIDGFYSPGHASLNADKERLKTSKHPYWIGRSGIPGGYNSVASRIQALRMAANFGEYATHIFMWSDRLAARFHWSTRGAFNVDFSSGIGRKVATSQLGVE